MKQDISQINPRKNGQMIFNEGAKEIHEVKSSLFNKWCWDNYVYVHMQRLTLDPYLLPYNS